MFSNPTVIEISRKFVCVRIDSYESEANQKLVRSHLNGRFANTAFCVLAPDGETRLTGSGRSPSQLYPRTEDFVSKLESILTKYPEKEQAAVPPLPDFNSFKLALNIASADQRVLMLIAGPADQLGKTEKRLRPLVWNADVQGRFHIDLETDAASWQKPLALSEDASSGIYVIQPGTYGLEGAVLERLDLSTKPKAILAALVNANTKHAETTEKKVYANHVRGGRAQGKSIEMAMPFGEDRDADGEIDQRGGRRR